MKIILSKAWQCMSWARLWCRNCLTTDMLKSILKTIIELFVQFDYGNILTNSFPPRLRFQWPHRRFKDCFKWRYLKFTVIQHLFAGLWIIADTLILFKIIACEWTGIFSPAIMTGLCIEYISLIWSRNWKCNLTRNGSPVTSSQLANSESSFC